MAGEMFLIHTAQITAKCIDKTFPPSLHDLIIRPHVKQFPRKSAPKILFLKSYSMVMKFFQLF